MRRNDAGAMVALIGGFTLWMGLTPTHLLYIKPSMTRWLILSGAILVAVGAAVLVLGWREARVAARTGGGAEEEARRGHHHATRVGWLLALPLCVAVAVGSEKWAVAVVISSSHARSW